MKNISKCWLRLRQSSAHLQRDDRGVGAVEFAMILPLMLLMFFGMIDISSGVGADRKVTIIAQSMADLASRSATVDNTEFTNFFNIGNAMLTPYPTTDLKITISQIYLDPTANGLGKVYWSKGSAPRAVNSTYAVPDGLIGRASGNVLPNQYLIFAEVTYLYKPIIGYVVAKSGMKLEELTFTRPRKSTCVFYSSANDCK